MASTLLTDMKPVILEAIESGATFKMAAWKAGISIAAINKWKKKGHEDKDAGIESEYSVFIDEVFKARYGRDKYYLDTIKVAAIKDWRAAAWFLERTNQYQFGANADELKKLDMLEQKINDLYDMCIKSE